MPGRARARPARVVERGRGARGSTERPGAPVVAALGGPAQSRAGSSRPLGAESALAAPGCSWCRRGFSLARTKRRVVKLAMEERSPASTARAAGLTHWLAHAQALRDPPCRRAALARGGGVSRARCALIGAGRARTDARTNGSSRPGDATAAFRPRRVTPGDSVRYLAEVGVSAIPHSHPHVRLGRPRAPRRTFSCFGVVAGSPILAPFVGLSSSCRSHMSLPSPRIDTRGPALPRRSASAGHGVMRPCGSTRSLPHGAARHPLLGYTSHRDEAARPRRLLRSRTSPGIPSVSLCFHARSANIRIDNALYRPRRGG